MAITGSQSKEGTKKLRWILKVEVKKSCVYEKKKEKKKLAVSPAELRFTLKAQSDNNAPLLADYHLECLIDSRKLDLVEMQWKRCW